MNQIKFRTKALVDQETYSVYRAYLALTGKTFTKSRGTNMRNLGGKRISAIQILGEDKHLGIRPINSTYKVTFPIKKIYTKN